MCWNCMGKNMSVSNSCKWHTCLSTPNNRNSHIRTASTLPWKWCRQPHFCVNLFGNSPRFIWIIERWNCGYRCLCHCYCCWWWWCRRRCMLHIGVNDQFISTLHHKWLFGFISDCHMYACILHHHHHPGQKIYCAIWRCEVDANAN